MAIFYIPGPTAERTHRLMQLQRMNIGDHPFGDAPDAAAVGVAVGSLAIVLHRDHDVVLTDADPPADGEPHARLVILDDVLALHVDDEKSEDVIKNDKACVRLSIGWWIGVGKHNVVIAMENDRKRTDGDTDCGGIGRIPKGMVTDIHPLKLH